ncbi:unnamed protein product [Closterium sp. NIES-54]
MHFQLKCDVAPLLCADAMLLEWMAEPRVGVLMDLGRIRSWLPDILSDIPSAACIALGSVAIITNAFPAAAAAVPAASVSPAAWSCCWRCSSCWAAYRRAVSFAAFLVLVARCPRFVTLCRAHASTSMAYPPIVSALGAGRQREKDVFASMLVQILGVKENRDLEQGFGAAMQNLLSGGLEKAHAEKKGRAGRGVVGGSKGKRQMENDGNLEGSWESTDGGGKDGRDGKGGQWREHLKGRVWERYVDGMAWILEHGGGEGREFRCSHCSEGASSSSSNLEGRDIPKGMYVSGVGATDFAVCVAAVLSTPQYRTENNLYCQDGNTASKTWVDDAAIETARERLRRRAQGEGGAAGRGAGATASTLQPATASTLQLATASTLQPATASTLQPATASTLQPATASTLQPATASTLQPATASTLQLATASTLQLATASTLQLATASTLQPATASTPAGGAGAVSPSGAGATASTLQPVSASAPAPPAASALAVAAAFSPSEMSPALVGPVPVNSNPVNTNAVIAVFTYRAACILK